MPKSEAEGYIDTNAHLRARVAELERQLDAERQRRFDGNRIASEERREELAAVQAREAKLRQSLANITFADEVRVLLRDMPADDAILREMIEAARVEGVEEAAKLCDWLNGEKRLTPAGCAAAIRAKIIK